LFGTPGFISTPHLGASTSEAQVNVAIQIAEQMSDFLLLGGVSNAINMPSLSAEEAPRLKPYMALAEKAGAKLSGRSSARRARVVDRGRGRGRRLNQKPITGAVLAGLMGTYSQREHGERAVLAKERGLDVREIRHDREGDYHTLLAVTSDHARATPRRGHPVRQPRAAAGRLFGVAVEAELDGSMLYIVNTDAPGFIGKLGRHWAKRGSTSQPSTSAAARRGGMPQRWSRSMARCRRGSRDALNARRGAQGGAAALLATP
jgi:D-3-phosphoglycerate dehydrogenase